MLKKIISQLNDAFIELDQNILVKTKEWAFEVRDVVSKIEKENRLNDIPYKITRQQKIDACGGKAWLELVTQYSNEDMLERIEKNCQKVAEKRNASIAKKLEKLEITEVEKSTCNITNNGFTGTFVVETNKGKKVVSIENIYAGGYNVQRLHLRTLVKVSNSKF